MTFGRYIKHAAFWLGIIGTHPVFAYPPANVHRQLKSRPAATRAQLPVQLLLVGTSFRPCR